MTETSAPKSWWLTLPGILTQLVTLITALTGLVAALYQIGWLGQQAQPPTPNPTANTRAIETVRPIPPPTQNTDTGGTPSPSPPTPPAAAPTSPPTGVFAIAIGDTVADGIPTPGAGRIESPGTEDVYQFSATPGQRVYFRMLKFDAGMSYIKWRLTDQDDQEVFDTCLGCSEPGVITLTKGGTYRLTVGNGKDPATGVYKLRLINVPAADRFDIQPSSSISPGVPGRGAGVIETPGGSDSYSFNAAPGQRIYFRLVKHDASVTYIRWRLTDQDDQAVFDTCLGCTEAGMQTLTKGGTYVLTVGNPKDPATGTYHLELTTP